MSADYRDTMMNKLFALCFAASLVTVTSTKADDYIDLRGVFEGRYAAMKSAMAKRDGNALSALLAPDFESIDVAGSKTTAAQMIDELKKLPVDARKTSETTILSVKVKGGTALIKQSYDMKTTKAGTGGALQNIELKTISEDTWVNSQGVWLCKSTTTDQLDYLVNDQVVAHKVRQR
jgi:hypothetical protein